MGAPLRRIAGLLAALALCAGLVAGCGGGDGGGGEDRTADLTPAEILRQSADAAAAVDSFRVALEATGQVDLTNPPAGVGGFLNGPFELSGEGPVQPPDRASIDSSVTVSGFPLQVNLTRVGDEVFLGALGQDFRVPLEPAQVALLDLGSLFPTLAGWTTDPAEAGREEIDGTETVKVEGTVDAEAAVAALAPVLGVDGVDPADARAAVRTGTVEAWVGTEDLLPRRVRLVLDADGARLSPEVGDVAVDLTASLSAFGEPVDIQPPDNPRDLDLDQLGSIVGG